MKATLSALIAACVLMSFNAQAQTDVIRVTDKRIQLTSVSRNRICGSLLADSQADLCFPDSPAIAQTMAQSKDLAVTSASTCAQDAAGKWTCWGLATPKLKSVVDKIVSEADPSQKPLKIGDNLCVVTASSVVSCTNYTGYTEGSLQSPNSGSANPAFQRFGPFKNLKDVAGSKSFLCVIADSKLRCQSNGIYGLPIAADISNPRLIAATDFSLCVIDDTGARCFGESPIEKLKNRPQWKDAKLMRGSGQGVCALRASGRLECETDIGKNTEQFQIPADLEPTADFGIGLMHMCALSVSGRVRCWGLDAYEGLLAVPQFNTRVVALGVGDEHACALLATGLIKCWGRTGEPQLQVPNIRGSKLKVATGRGFSCSFTPSGVSCDGSAYGTGTVPDLKSVITVAVPPSSGDSACAIEQIPSPLNNASAVQTAAKCWGLSGDISSVPEAVVNPKLLSMSTNYACAASDSIVTCWGHEEALKTAYPDRIRHPRKLVTAQKHACLTDEYGLACWGDLQPEDGLDLRVPSEYEGRNAVVDVAVGDRHTCVLTSQKEVKCWGDNAYGQLNVPALDNPVSLGAVESMTCATDSKGVSCWGEAFGLGEKAPAASNSGNNGAQPRLPFPGASSRYPYHIDP